MTEREMARVLLPLARWIRADRRGVGSITVDYGYAHSVVKGESANPQRDALNYTGDHASLAFGALHRSFPDAFPGRLTRVSIRKGRKVGGNLAPVGDALARAEALLNLALLVVDGAPLGGAADRKARYRKGTGEGWCAVCSRNPVDGRKVCSPCNELAKERVRRSRERRRQQAA